MDLNMEAFPEVGAGVTLGALTASPGGGATGSVGLGFDRVGAAVLDEPRTSTAGDAAMERYAAGDDASFEALYDSLAARIYSYLRRRVPDPHRCDDLLQETFLRMHKARGTFVTGAAVLPWAFAIARRLVLDQMRRDRRSPTVASDMEAVEPVPASQSASADLPEQLLEARECAQSLAGALARLPESQRTAFELLKQDGLTLAEAAAVLGVTVTAVKQRAHRAYESLRAALGEDVGNLLGKVHT
jgi:RNA polymerase sigma-70 factor (ECF subfamily)